MNSWKCKNCFRVRVDYKLQQFNIKNFISEDYMLLQYNVPVILNKIEYPVIGAEYFGSCSKIDFYFCDYKL